MSANPPQPQIDPALATALSAFGPWGALAGLALTFGVPFVDHMIQNSKNNVPPTAEEWASLVQKINTPFKAL